LAWISRRHKLSQLIKLAILADMAIIFETTSNSHRALTHTSVVRTGTTQAIIFVNKYICFTPISEREGEEEEEKGVKERERERGGERR
jgi:hypothetical protein